MGWWDQKVKKWDLKVGQKSGTNRHFDLQSYLFSISLVIRLLGRARATPQNQKKNGVEEKETSTAVPSATSDLSISTEALSALRQNQIRLQEGQELQQVERGWISEWIGRRELPEVNLDPAC